MGGGAEGGGVFWEDEEVAFLKVAAAGRGDFSSDDGDDGEAVVRVFEELASLEVDLLDDEVLAGGEGVSLGLVHAGLEVVKVDGGHRFLDVEVACFAIESHAVPIKDAVGGVGVLLDFVDEEAGPDGVEAA